ncbi:MAG: hypothetical protein QF406_11180 [Verrucomicrobiota bacterium]|nr:hypothetical protein [Verrucomicrobiota bacterium]
MRTAQKLFKGPGFFWHWREVRFKPRGICPKHYPKAIRELSLRADKLIFVSAHYAQHQS